MSSGRREQVSAQRLAVKETLCQTWPTVCCGVGCTVGSPGRRVAAMMVQRRRCTMASADRPIALAVQRAAACEQRRAA